MNATPTVDDVRWTVDTLRTDVSPFVYPNPFDGITDDDIADALLWLDLQPIAEEI